MLKPRLSSLSSGYQFNQTENPTKAVIVCVLLAVFTQLTGISAILFYSSQIFCSKSDETNIYQGIVVSALVGSVSFGATFISLLFVDKAGRKLLLLIGAVIMCISNAMTGVFE